jgi:hypothetical protein
MHRRVEHDHAARRPTLALDEVLQSALRAKEVALEVDVNHLTQ